MSSYFEYITDDGPVIIEAESKTEGIIRAANRDGIEILKTEKKLTDALASIRGTLKALVTELDCIAIEEAEVKFGIKAIGEGGIFAIGKVGGEMNYEVTLKWKKPGDKSK